MAGGNRAWTRKRLLRLLSNAKFDLFSDKGFKPTSHELDKWLTRYLNRETFIARQKKKKQ